MNKSESQSFFEKICCFSMYLFMASKQVQKVTDAISKNMKIINPIPFTFKMILDP